MKKQAITMAAVLIATAISISASATSPTVSDLMRAAGGRLTYNLPNKPAIRLTYRINAQTWVVEEQTAAGWTVILRTNNESEAVQLMFAKLGIGNPAPTPTAPAISTPAPQPTATAILTPTPQPTQPPTGHLDEDTTWHPPGAHGDRPAHEHGDRPPQWLLDWHAANPDAPFPRFSHGAMTPGENTPYWKHTAFKGWAGTFPDDLGRPNQWYGVFHLDFNPGGHPSRFHSYQLWIRDPSGNVSYMRGWLDFGVGDSTGPQLVPQCQRPGIDDNVRPIMNPPVEGCSISFESWYARAGGSGGWAPDFGFNINPNYYAGGDPGNPATWKPTGGVRNLERRVEWAWYRFRSTLTGVFWTTQWGDLVTGPNDSVCGTTRRYGERTYTVLCLSQYIAPTLRTIGFPGNSDGRMFPGAGVVVLPN